jgi:hypothetical protein
VLVVCVLGGVSYLELSQVQRALDSALRSHNKRLRGAQGGAQGGTRGGAESLWSRIVVVSTDTLSPIDLLRQTLGQSTVA